MENMSNSSGECDKHTVWLGHYTQNDNDDDSSVENQLNPEGNQSPKLVSGFGTVMNMLNSLLGAGILAIPSSFSSAGVVPSVIILCLMAVLCHVTTIMILRLRAITQVDGYDALVSYYFGKYGTIVFTVLALVFVTAGSLSYIIVGGDMIVSWFAIANIDLTPTGYRALTVLVYALCLPIALTIPRHLKILSYFSAATMFFFILYCAVMIYKLIDFLVDGDIHPGFVIARIDTSIFSAISVYALAYSLPVVAISIFNEYSEDMKKRTMVTGVASSLTFLILVIPSVIGYIIFGDKADGNILNSFPDDDIVMIIVRVGFFLIVSFSYPIILAGAVTSSWGHALFKVSQASDLVGWRRAVVLIVSNAVQLIIGMFLPKAKPAIAIGGAFGGCIVDFAFPGLLWIKASEHKLWHWDNILCMLLILFGIIFAILSTYYSILDAIQAFKPIE